MPILNPKKISLTITTTNALGRKWKNVNVKLIRIDDYFYHNPKEIEGVTNDDGILKFNSILEGAYLVQISTKKVFLEEVHVIRKNELIKIKIPSIFGWFHKEKELNVEELRNFYEKFRTDKEVCFKCKKPYKSYTDRFLCKYCGKYFCSEHRLPENHDCWGEPKAPSGGFREIHTKNGIIVTGK